MQMWNRAGVVGGCGWRANDDDRVAEHAYAADRFAREIVGLLKVVGGALAAADRQTVGRADKGRGHHNRLDWASQRMPGRSTILNTRPMPGALARMPRRSTD